MQSSIDNLLELEAKMERFYVKAQDHEKLRQKLGRVERENDDRHESTYNRFQRKDEEIEKIIHKANV